MKAAVLFATDIAARGLDFPAVDWVLQVDAPEDADTYIHRVGRTARYERKGQSLLFVLPSEEDGMMKVLKGKGIEPEKIKAKESKTLSIKDQLQSFAFQDPEIKYLGQRVSGLPSIVYERRKYPHTFTYVGQAFVSYVRSVHLQKNRDIFKVGEMPLKDFAAALGLPGAPKVKFANKNTTALKKNTQHVVAPTAVEDPSEDESSDEEETHINTTVAPEKVRIAVSRTYIRARWLTLPFLSFHTAHCSNEV